MTDDRRPPEWRDVRDLRTALTINAAAKAPIHAGAALTMLNMSPQPGPDDFVTESADDRTPDTEAERGALAWFREDPERRIDALDDLNPYAAMIVRAALARDDQEVAMLRRRAETAERALSIATRMAEARDVPAPTDEPPECNNCGHPADHSGGKCMWFDDGVDMYDNPVQRGCGCTADPAQHAGGGATAGQDQAGS